MRIVRLFGVVLAIFTAGLLLTTPAGAQPPDKLTEHLTDTTKVLTDSDRATANAAIDRLSRDRHIQLWVVYVDNFSRFKPENWADQTRSASGMGDRDALLAVATNTRATTTKLYAFSVSTKVLPAGELNTLQLGQIEPAVNAKEWSRAAVAAADGLNKPGSTPKRNWLPIAIAVAVAVLAVVLLLLFLRHRRRAARQVDAGGGPLAITTAAQALSVADTRVRQISDYVAKHRDRVGAEAQSSLDEAKRHLSAARGKESSNGQEAIAHANRASTLAAQAQTQANADVLAAHSPQRRRGRTAKR